MVATIWRHHTSYRGFMVTCPSGDDTILKKFSPEQLKNLNPAVLSMVSEKALAMLNKDQKTALRGLVPSEKEGKLNLKGLENLPGPLGGILGHAQGLLGGPAKGGAGNVGKILGMLPFGKKGGNAQPAY